LSAPAGTLRNQRLNVKGSNLSKHSSPAKSTKPSISLEPVLNTDSRMGRGFSRVISPESPITIRLAASPCSRYNSVVPPVSQTVRVKVLFFGRLKDVVGQSEESLDLADGSTIDQLFALYSERIPELAKYRSSVVASRNQEFASWDTLLHSGDEVAFLPPVSGG
jgi:sulfur-carrier protein